MIEKFKKVSNSKLKWADKDMINFAKSFKGYMDNPTAEEALEIWKDLIELKDSDLDKSFVFNSMKNEVTVTVSERAEVEVCNFDKDTAWIRWYMPDFSDNGNIDLPKGKNYKLKQRTGDKVTVEAILKKLKPS